MTFPPAKRQRKLILSDDDDEPVVKTRRAPPRLSSGSKITLSDRTSINRDATPKKHKAKSIAKASPKYSPEKANRRATNDGKENKSLHTFFGRATEDQRWARKDKTPPTAVEDGEAGDDIEDDSLDDAFAELADCEGEHNLVLDRRKTRDLTSRNGLPIGIKNGIASSQKFTKPAKPAAKVIKPGSTKDQNGNRPWAEKFAPSSLEELAVHKKKVADVQNWLSAVLQGRDRRRLLVLKGPAGSGKTTTIHLLSEAMDFAVSEWRSPTVGDTGIASFSSQFDDFLNRGGSFGALDLSTGTSHLGDFGTHKLADTEKRILLVEEFPSTMTLSSSALSSFRNVLLQYLAAAVPPRSAVFEQANSHLRSHPPIILIISESLLTSATAATDSFTAHRLLGPDLCNHPYASILEFNPVAPTLVTKSLELAIKKEARISKRRRIPGPAVLKRLSELGDVRSAVNGLEFLCVRGDADSDWGGRTAAKAKKLNGRGPSLTTMERDSLELVTQREATLGIFHAVGKVVWNKREDSRIADPTAEPPPKPPDHMAAFERLKVSRVNIDELLNEIGTDIQTFTAALHENYVLSTGGSHFAESASDCIDFLSESDLLSRGSRQISRSSHPGYGSGGTALQASGIDMLRQNEISFQVAVRGLLFSLPSPVSRATHSNGRKGDSFKMFYPASLKIWKPTEEIHALVSTQMRRLSIPDTGNPEHMPSSSRAEGVESWKFRNLSQRSAIDPEMQNDNNNTTTNPRIWATRDELLLERLPYMASIASSSSSSSSHTEKLTHDLKKITQLTGIPLNTNATNNDDDDADLEIDDATAAVEVDLSAADETTDQVTSPLDSNNRRAGFREDVRAPPGKGVLDLVRQEEEGAGVEKLYIEEDDIEDD